MDYRKWMSNMLPYPDVQKYLEEKAGTLVNIYFKDKSEYAVEKFVKSFGESIVYLQNSIMRSEGIHPSQIEANYVELMTDSQSAVQKIERLKQTLRIEIDRQFRHFQTFLSEFYASPATESSHPKMTVDTPGGAISIYAATDPEYPGVYIDIDNKSVALVEFDGYDKKFAARVWNKEDEDPVFVLRYERIPENKDKGIEQDG